uniref:PBPb domain-containing protein n=1 Tax=Steinernema glaseri TaxID=37863 RepID=A0A1I7YFD2_9BILA
MYRLTAALLLFFVSLAHSQWPNSYPYPYPYPYYPEPPSNQVVSGVMNGFDRVVLGIIDTARRGSLELKYWGQQVGLLPRINIFSFKKK